MLTDILSGLSMQCSSGWSWCRNKMVSSDSRWPLAWRISMEGHGSADVPQSVVLEPPEPMYQVAPIM